MLRLDVPVADAQVEAAIVRAFELAEELELKFSKFREMSDIARLNRASPGREVPVSQEFIALLPFCTDLWRESAGAFNPFKTTDFSVDPMICDDIRNQAYAARASEEVELDFSGVAKGFIVDQLVDFFLQTLNGASGVVDAGGDLRFFGQVTREANIRIPFQFGIFQKITPRLDALASSSFEESEDNPLSKTDYPQQPRRGLNRQMCVSVNAPTCAAADALTKVVWFADEEVAARCLLKYAAEASILSGA